VVRNHCRRSRRWQTRSGSVTTVTGEIIDFSCYLQLGKHGEKHQSLRPEMLNTHAHGLLTKDGRFTC